MRLLRYGWVFKRTACPLCAADSQRLANVAVEREPALRIDHCESCGGYFKTYNGEGDEPILLADWSSLHLDLIAHEREPRRLAASLYDFAPVRPSSRAAAPEPAGLTGRASAPKCRSPSRQSVGDGVRSHTRGKTIEESASQPRAPKLNPRVQRHDPAGSRC